MRATLMTRNLLSMGVLGAAWMAFAQPTPNVVFILADDQGWTGLSAQMDPNVLGPLSASDFYETPNLEVLASQGMRFRQAYAAAPNCSPTRSSIATGMSPTALNLTDIVSRGDLYGNAQGDSLYSGNDLTPPYGASRLPVGVESLAMRIKAADPNYVTAHFGKWHLTAQAVKPSEPGGAVAHVDGDPGDYGYDVNDGSRGNNPISTSTDPKEMFSMTSRAIDFLNDRVGVGGDNRPFYLQISHFAVHAPDATLAETKAKYDAKNITDPGDRHPDGAGNTTFAGMTENLDTAVGQILDYLDNTPDPRNPGHMLADNTYVFYMADNGAVLASGNNLPLYAQKATTWEGGIRVPLIVRGPGITANSVSNVPVISTDMYATISALTGATTSLPQRSESANLVGLLMNHGQLPEGVDGLQRSVGENGELFFHFPHYQHEKGTTPMSGMVSGDGVYKFVRIYGAQGQPTRDYLFDMATPIDGPFDTWEIDAYDDPRNLANDPFFAGQLASMQQQFDAWIQDVDGSLPYELSTPMTIEWRANDNSRARNLEGPTWRSVTDVDNRGLEQLRIDESAGTVTLVDITPSQPQLGDKAYHMDSAGGFLTSFFHVSDLDPGSNRLTGPADEDDSVTFECWLRADALNQGQVLLETGGGNKGLAITIGAADNDGQVNDLRLRAVEDSAGRALIATASLAGVDITHEFVHVVAIIAEDTAYDTQTAKIYLNGALAAESSEVLGGGNVDWDGINDAGIGMVQGVLGASGGPGAGNLGSAGFAGDIAAFSFVNYAMTEAEVELRHAFDFSFVPGDFDRDGALTTADLVVFQANWLADTSALPSASARYELGDIDNSSRVDLLDFRALRDIVHAYGLTALASQLQGIFVERGDFDGDGDAGADDAQALLGCISGPGLIPDDACYAGDVDFNLVVDVADVARFQGCFAGDGEALGTGCAQ